MNFFDGLNHVIRESEASVVNLLSSIAPWLAPLAPAYLSFHHMTTYLDYPVYIALAVAIVVEVLGLASISTILAFWSHNKRYSKTEYKKAPTMIAVFSFVSYLGIVLLINVGIDASRIMGTESTQGWMIIGARAMLTLLSVPAAIILAVRTQHKELIDGLREEKEMRRRDRKMRRFEPTQKPQAAPKRSSPRRGSSNTRKKQFFEDLQSGKIRAALNGSELTADTIAATYGVSERTAFRWLADAKQE